MIASKLYKPLNVAFCSQNIYKYKQYYSAMHGITQFKFISKTIHEIY
nr:hypothetical protein [Mucilaginibacter sp. E4BP6]